MDLMSQYDDALREIVETGVSRTNKRTGIKTLSVFGMSKRFRLDTEFFPILTRRKTWPKSVFSELLWFLSGSTNNQDLKNLGCNFWTPWVDRQFEQKNGFSEDCFGPVYGFQLRHFGGVYGNGSGGFNKIGYHGELQIYTEQYIQDECTEIDAGTTTKSILSRIRLKPLSGTVYARIYLQYAGTDSLACELKDAENSSQMLVIDNDLGNTEIPHITDANIDHETGVIELHWNVSPGTHYAKITYEGSILSETNIYGKGGFDQLSWVINRIKEDPSCRRTLWTLWNPQDVSKMRLPPCHMMYQVLVDDDRNLTGIMYMRSADYPIGVPANIQFYSTLTKMIAQQTDCNAKEFVLMTGDSHVYEDQLPAIREYLDLPKTESPRLEIKKAVDIFSYKPEDFVVSDFNPGPKLDIPVAV